MNESDLLKSKAREMLAKIPVEEKRELVAKSRWTCDSNWMMAMVMQGSWDVANKMNLQMGQKTAKVEMHRLMKSLNLEKPRNERECMMLMTLAMETFITKDYFDYEFELTRSGEWVGIIKQCYAYTKVKSIHVDKNYQCGCFGLRAGWYEAMGIEVREKLVKCLKDGADQCEIVAEQLVFPQERKAQVYTTGKPDKVTYPD